MCLFARPDQVLVHHGHSSQLPLVGPYIHSGEEEVQLQGEEPASRSMSVMGGVAPLNVAHLEAEPSKSGVTRRCPTSVPLSQASFNAAIGVQRWHEGVDIVASSIGLLYRPHSSGGCLGGRGVGGPVLV